MVGLVCLGARGSWRPAVPWESRGTEMPGNCLGCFGVLLGLKGLGEPVVWKNAESGKSESR